MDNPSHRRDFVRTLALGASAAALTSPACGGADAPRSSDRRSRSPSPRRSRRRSRPGWAWSLPGSARCWTRKRRKAVEARVAAIVRRAEALRKFELDNGDGPFPVFTPYRAPLAGGEGPPQ